MDIETLVKITSRAWALKVLALIHEGVAGRQAPLLAASGASRTAFVQSLRHLEELGFLERNPGHGHPLRPEFRLTSQGQEIAPIAHRIDAATRDDAGAVLVRKVWTVPVLAVARKPRVFSELKRELGPITDRALSKSLRDLNDQNWIERSVNVELRPPRPSYQVVNEGAQISQAVGVHEGKAVAYLLPCLAQLVVSALNTQVIGPLRRVQTARLWFIRDREEKVIPKAVSHSDFVNQFRVYFGVE